MEILDIFVNIHELNNGAVLHLIQELGFATDLPNVHRGVRLMDGLYCILFASASVNAFLDRAVDTSSEYAWINMIFVLDI